jgi:hypothetical protein
VIEKVLVRAMRGHESGLSGDPGTQSDYVRVMERFFQRNPDCVSPAVRRRALFAAYARNAHSAIVSRRIPQAVRFLRKALRSARSRADCMQVLRLGSVLCKVTGVEALRFTGLRSA